MMEADSTTYDNNQKTNSIESSLPFPVHPGNLQLYKEITDKSSDERYQQQLVRKLQEINLLPKTRECPVKKPDCCMKCVPARVVDRLQWMCPTCKTRFPVRGNSFFLRIHCTLLQSLQMILAWCEDADWEAAAQHFDVKPKVAYSIYDKLDQLSIDEHVKCKLGGENGVVLAEIYPDCLNRLSPDTTDQPHVHRVLMLADTNHIPTRYWLHIIKDSASAAEVSRVVKKAVVPGSTVVVGNYVPMITDAISLQTLTQHCDAEMQHFLCERIWHQAVSICAASRDICAGGACNTAVQKYLTSSLYRLQYGDGFYHHILTLIATHHTKEDPHHTELSPHTIDESNSIVDGSNQTIDESHLNVDDSRLTVNDTQNTMVESQRTMDDTQSDLEMEDSQKTIEVSQKTIDDSQHIKADSCDIKLDAINTMEHSHLSKVDLNYTKKDSHQPMEDLDNPHQNMDDSLHGIENSQMNSTYHRTIISDHTIDNLRSAIDPSHHYIDPSHNTIDPSHLSIDASLYNIDPTYHTVEASHYTSDELNQSMDDSNKDFYTLQNVPMVIENSSGYID